MTPERLAEIEAEAKNPKKFGWSNPEGTLLELAAHIRDLEAQVREAREALKEAPCRCDVRFRHECPDCGAKLIPVPSHRYLNDDQWDAVKAGDFYCSGACTSDAPSGKRYFRYRHLATYVKGPVCKRCAALATATPPSPEVK